MGKFIDHGFCAGSMGNPGIQLNLTRFEIGDDLPELFACCVAATEQG
ncbi:hypothetical protein [Dictyobacter kobayashii]|nr:hypothetical protein [Dictyobacter kobayashii]